MIRASAQESRRTAVKRALAGCVRCPGVSVKVPGGSYCNKCGLVADGP